MAEFNPFAVGDFGLGAAHDVPSSVLRGDAHDLNVDHSVGGDIARGIKAQVAHDLHVVIGFVRDALVEALLDFAGVLVDGVSPSVVPLFEGVAVTE